MKLQTILFIATLHLMVISDEIEELKEKLELLCKHYTNIYQMESSSKNQHVSCLPPEEECTAHQILIAKPQFILEKINNLRLITAIEYNAADMKAVEWDNELAVLAMAIAANCFKKQIKTDWTIGVTNKTNRVGYFASRSTTTDFDDEDSPSWKSALTDAGLIEKAAKAAKPKISQIKDDVIQFPIHQLFHSQVSHVGCAYTMLRLKSQKYYVCLFRERVDGDDLYAVGNTCGLCDSGYKCGSVIQVNNALCVSQLTSKPHAEWAKIEKQLNAISEKHKNSSGISTKITNTKSPSSTNISSNVELSSTNKLPKTSMSITKLYSTDNESLNNTVKSNVEKTVRSTGKSTVPSIHIGVTNLTRNHGADEDSTAEDVTNDPQPIEGDARPSYPAQNYRFLPGFVPYAVLALILVFFGTVCAAMGSFLFFSSPKHHDKREITASEHLGPARLPQHHYPQTPSPLTTQQPVQNIILIDDK